MTTRLWLLRGLRFHYRHHLAVAAGAALTTAILAAALLTGEALNRNLRRVALERLGGARSAIALPNRRVDAALAERLAAAAHARVAPLLRLPASFLAVVGDDETRVDGVTAYGVDARFWDIIGGAPDPRLTDGEALLSQRLAEAIAPDAATPALRFAPPPRLAFDLPLADDRLLAPVRRPLSLRGVRADASGGRFSLLP
jgi:hypothetical protein